MSDIIKTISDLTKIQSQFETINRISLPYLNNKVFDQALGVARIVPDSLLFDYQNRFVDLGLNSIIDSFKGVQDRIASVSRMIPTALISTYQDRIFGINTFSSSILSRYEDSFSNIVQLSLGVLNTERNLRNMFSNGSLSKTIQSYSSYHEEWLEKYRRSLEEIVNSLDDSDVEIIDDQLYRYGDDTIEFDEIQNKIDSFKEASNSVKNGSIEKWIANLLEMWGKEHPLIKKILGTILIPFVIGFLVNQITSTPNIINNINVYNYNINKSVKAMKNEVKRYNWDSELYKNLRFVSVPKLNIYAHKKIQGKKIGELALGNTVRVIVKNKNWSLIERFDEENDVYIRGWVLTRYISRFD